MKFLYEHVGAVRAIAFSPDNAVLGSTGNDCKVRFWPLQSADTPQVIELNDQEVPPSLNIGFSLQFSPSNSFAAVAHDFGVSRCYSGKVKKVSLVSSPIPIANSVAFCSNGRLLIVGMGDKNPPSTSGVLSIYDTVQFKKLQDRATPGGVLAMAGDPTGKRIFWGGHDKQIHAWDLTKLDSQHSVRQGSAIRSIALSANKEMIAVSDDYRIGIYESGSLRQNRVLAGHQGRVDSLAYLPDGRLISGSWDQTIRIWDPVTGRQLSAHNWEIGGIRAVAVSPDGMLAAAGGDRGTIALWDMDH